MISIKSVRRVTRSAVLMLTALLIVSPAAVSAVPLTGKEYNALIGNRMWWDDALPAAVCEGAVSELPTGDYEENAKNIFQYFINKGLKPFQAAGIMGNMQAESGLNPRALQPGTTGDAPIEGRGYGLVQWTYAARQRPLVKMAADTNRKVYDLGLQLDYVHWEMSESDDWGKVWERLLATSDVVVATRYVEDHYEIHAGGPQPKRISWARGFLAKYGSLTPGGPVEGDVSCDETTAVGPDGWIWPVKGDIRPGPCWNAVVGGRYHAGMDINSTKANNPAIAAANGVVVMTGRGSASGNYVIIKSNEGDIYYSYQHLESIAVTQDKPIAAGAVVGIIGKTGNVRLGPGNQGHLHFVTAKIQTLGEYSQSSQVGGSTTDPLNYLPKDAPDGYRCTK